MVGRQSIRLQESCCMNQDPTPCSTHTASSHFYYSHPTGKVTCQAASGREPGWLSQPPGHALLLQLIFRTGTSIHGTQSPLVAPFQFFLSPTRPPSPLPHPYWTSRPSIPPGHRFAQSLLPHSPSPFCPARTCWFSEDLPQGH